jgi:hypothetical protein
MEFSLVLLMFSYAGDGLDRCTIRSTNVSMFSSLSSFTTKYLVNKMVAQCHRETSYVEHFVIYRQFMHVLKPALVLASRHMELGVLASLHGTLYFTDKFHEIKSTK